MHLTSASHGWVLGFLWQSLAGAHLPIAAGAAWSAPISRYAAGGQKFCFFGDGTTKTIGAFHEAAEFGGRLEIGRVVFVCENNLYMEYTPPIGAVTAVEASGRRTGGRLRPRVNHCRWERR